MQSPPERTGRNGKTEPTVEPALPAALIEKWALAYLERYASSAENLRRVLRRRVRRRLGADSLSGAEAVRAAGSVIDALVARYRTAGLIDDAAYAAGRARSGLARGRSLRRIAAGLAAKGIGAEEAAAAVAALRGGSADPDLAAACAFARRRHLGPFRRGPVGPSPSGYDKSGAADRQRELAAFARAGFERRAAEAVLACADAAAIAVLLMAEGSD